MSILGFSSSKGQTIESLLSEVNQRMITDDYEDSISLAENHRLIRQWPELQALASLVNRDPIAAAEFALVDSGVEKFPIISAAAEADPLQFLRFWNRVSQASFLNEEHVDYVMLGLINKDSPNHDTLIFYHDVPAIAAMLKRLSKLVKANESTADNQLAKIDTQLTLDKLKGVIDGTWKASRTRYFEEYGPDDWRKFVPDLRGLVVLENGDMAMEPAAAVAGLAEPKDVRPDPSGVRETSSAAKWPFLLGAIGVVGILFLLIRAFLRGRAS